MNNNIKINNKQAILLYQVPLDSSDHSLVEPLNKHQNWKLIYCTDEESGGEDYNSAAIIVTKELYAYHKNMNLTFLGLYKKIDEEVIDQLLDAFEINYYAKNKIECLEKFLIDNGVEIEQEYCIILIEKKPYNFHR